jgi:hypothetical protein
MVKGPAVLLGMLLGTQPSLAQVPPIESVRQSELAFAHLAAEKGIRTAFLTWMKGDARVFTPTMTSARDKYSPEPGDPGHLVWYPEAMAVSAAGDLAWSHGPWTYAPKKGEAILVHGHFLSVWARQSEGNWRVIADIGVSHPAPEQPIDLFSPAMAPPRLAGGSRAGGSLAQLRDKETQLAKAWSTQGGVALFPELAAGACVLRPRQAPLHQPAAIKEALRQDSPGSQWAPATLQVAASGDLGWTCGESSPDNEGHAASFLRIWVFEGGAWKVRFDVRLPIQPVKP